MLTEQELKGHTSEVLGRVDQKVREGVISLQNAYDKVFVDNDDLKRIMDRYLCMSATEAATGEHIYAFVGEPKEDTSTKTWFFPVKNLTTGGSGTVAHFMLLRTRIIGVQPGEARKGNWFSESRAQNRVLSVIRLAEFQPDLVNGREVVANFMYDHEPMIRQMNLAPDKGYGIVRSTKWGALTQTEQSIRMDALAWARKQPYEQAVYKKWLNADNTLTDAALQMRVGTVIYEPIDLPL